VIFGILLAYFIVYEGYFVVGDFFVELLWRRMFILLYIPYFLVYDLNRHEWVLRYWSLMDMSEGW
jgi:hypothetical protein